MSWVERFDKGMHITGRSRLQVDLRPSSCPGHASARRALPPHNKLFPPSRSALTLPSIAALAQVAVRELYACVDLVTGAGYQQEVIVFGFVFTVLSRSQPSLGSYVQSTLGTSILGSAA